MAKTKHNITYHTIGGWILLVKGTTSPLYAFAGMIQIYPDKDRAQDVAKTLRATGSCKGLEPVTVTPCELRIPQEG